MIMLRMLRSPGACCAVPRVSSMVEHLSLSSFPHLKKEASDSIVARRWLQSVDTALVLWPKQNTKRTGEDDEIDY